MKPRLLPILKTEREAVFVKKKAVLLLGALFLLLGAACVSLGRVSQGEEYVAAAGAQSLYRLDIAQARGTIYDCNLQPLVGGETQYVAAVAPTIQSIGALEKATDGAYRDRLALALENGKPLQLVLESPVDDPRIDVFQVPQRYTENQLAPHIIGYLDSLGGGAAGIELAMDDVLRQYEGEISVTYQVDALGRAIAGGERQVVDTLEDSQGGVALTLDSEIQALAQEAAQGLGKGTVVVTQAPDCQIRAVASVPDFSPLDLGSATESQDAPLVNRGFSAYAPGSVFKLVTAAALLEADLGDTTFHCQGYVDVGGLRFHCVNATAHGELDLTGALEQSCNCYFINAARALGGQEILTMAYNLGFGTAQEFGRGLWTSSGDLPSLSGLENVRALANFSFGQGDLTVTPLQLCAMMNAICSGGVYASPKLIEGVVNTQGELSPASSQEDVSRKAMSASTFQILKAALVSAAQEGTGQVASPSNGTAGIKTGTAQTGVFQGEEELLHFWYSGFVQGKDGVCYCITVLKESAVSGQEDAALVFQEVAQGILALGDEKGN